jgi:large subunit ribosomal protein L17
MRHGKKVNHLSRTSAHRSAMLSNMAISLITKKRINTTVAKAKELRKYVEPLLTRSKDDSTNSRRVVFSYLQDKEAVTELFREVAVKIAHRPGGYTRILKTGNRLGDNAEMCMMELVDYNENMLAEKTTKKAKTTRRRGAGAKKTKEAAIDEISTEVEVEEKKPKAKKTAKKEDDIVEEIPTDEVKTEAAEEHKEKAEEPATEEPEK